MSTLSYVRIAALCLAGLLLPGTALAQEHAPAAPAEHKAQASPAPPGQNTGSPSQDVVQASEEAARAEDEEAQFKYSPSVQWLAGKLGVTKETAYWIALGLNFAVVAGFIVWAARKYAPGAFRDRTELIRKQMEEARVASEEANRRLADIEGRLSRLDTEVGGLRAGADRDAAAEEQRIRAAAEEDKRKIVASAEQEIASAAKVARGELKRYAAGLAVTLAEKKIQVNVATDQALVRDFVDHLGKGSKS